jgi:hypothetical protein
MSIPKPPAPPVVNDPTLVDNPHAPEVFADDALGFFLRGGVVRITFSTGRVDHRTSPGPINRIVVGRMAMPLSGAQDLAMGLYDFLKKMGADPARRQPEDVVQ